VSIKQGSPNLEQSLFIFSTWCTLHNSAPNTGSVNIPSGPRARIVLNSILDRYGEV